MKKTDMKKKRNAVEKDEESKSSDFLPIGFSIVMILLFIFILGFFGKLSMHVYKMSGSILYATMTFIIGIIFDLTFFDVIATMDDDPDLARYLFSTLVVLIIIELILALISLL